MTAGDIASIRVVGGLLPPDVLTRILAGDGELGGLAGADYHRAAGESAREAANRAWTYLLGAWASYRAALARLPEGDPAVGLTREKWLTVLFRELDYGRLPATPAGGMVVDEKAFPVSHVWQSTPVHLLGWGVELDKRTKGVPGAAERAPQAMLQELLNRSKEHLWAILANGRSLRLLRDSTSLAGHAYVEFDLETMFDGELFSDFVLLYLLAHQSRVEVPAEGGPGDCWLERWRTSAAESGTRALGLLRDGVTEAIAALGTGFLQAPGNDLHQRISDGELSLADYQRGLLRLVYRLLFLFVAEDRGVLLQPDAEPVACQRYRDFFGTGRLRVIARKRRGTRHADLWQGLQLVLTALGTPGGQPRLGLPGIGGLFDPQPVDVVMGQRLSNEALLTAVRKLSVVQPRGTPPRIVDYRNLGAEELGSVYESLLELVPRHDRVDRTFTLEVLPGHDRKTSGSYYTPSSLIDLVLDEALDPLLDEREKRKHAEQALLSMTVCDPACGSGHFLVAAARRIATRLARVRTGEFDPTPADVQDALHDVVARCIYGVDLNPMAAELAKVSLWLEAMRPGRPLTFLDAHIKVGNALLGTTPALLEQGLPDDAFVALTGDDRQWTTKLKRRNKSEREERTQADLFDSGHLVLDTRALARAAQALRQAPTASLADVHAQQRRFAALQQDPDYAKGRLLADAWCAAFVQRKEPDILPITHATLMLIQLGEQVGSGPSGLIEQAATTYRFFHWHLEFPEVFSAGVDGGFTCMVGNPPWERVNLQEQEFFASRDEAIATAPNAAARKRLIAELKQGNPALAHEFNEALRRADAESHLLRDSGRFPLTGKGDVNTYSVFAETFRDFIETEGQCGIITPTGLATDATTAEFFSDTLQAGRLASFSDFENRRPLFLGVDSRFRFAVTCMTGRNRRAERVPLAFMLHDPNDVQRSRFELSTEEIMLLNPNTGTLPVFASRRDAEITLKIYRRFPILIKDGDPDGNPWGLKFMRMFDMANDAHLFRTREKLEAEGYVLQGNIFVRPASGDPEIEREGSKRFLPLYEAKMMNLYDHRFGTYEGATGKTIPAVTDAQHDDPFYEPLPRYWVAQTDVDAALTNGRDTEYLLGWRKITRSTDARSFITASMAIAGAGDSLMLAEIGLNRMTSVQSIWSSLVMDYQLRQKLSGTNFQFFVIKQLACPPPAALDLTPAWLNEPLNAWLIPRVLELTYASHAMAGFAREVGDVGKPYRWVPPRRQQIRAEMDAAMFHLYGLDRGEVEHVLDSFTVLNRYDLAQHGDLRTKIAVLGFYDAMAQAAESGVPYATPIDPAPGFGPRHEESTRPGWMKEQA